jgi:pimeloyl-ACP methyl ester carboxylesterase
MKPILLGVLFCTAAISGVAANEPAAKLVPVATPASTAAPAAWKFYSVRGSGDVPLNVVTSGDPAKPAIVLVHGIGQSYLSWENQLRAPLTDEFFVVAYDLRGHGNSGKPFAAEAYQNYQHWAGDLRAVIEATGAKRPVVVGWSYGSLVVADYLRAYGTGDLRGIVLTGAYGGLTRPPPPPSAELLATMAPMREKSMSPHLEDTIAYTDLFARFLTAKSMPDAYYARAARISLMLPGYASRWMWQRSFANQDQIAKIDVPLLILVGGKDNSTPEKDAHELAAKVPGARVSVYPDSGHSLFAEDAERFSGELAEFARAKP